MAGRGSQLFHLRGADFRPMCYLCVPGLLANTCMKKFLTLLAFAALALTSCNLLEDPSEYDGKLVARTDVPLKSFYKDLFLDGGIRATSKKSLPAAEMLSLSQEYLITPDSEYTRLDTLAQHRVFIGDDDDFNGYLLYPDESPRYRCVFVNGGNSTAHGRSLTESARINFRTFVRNGGCYIGSCAGAYLAAKGSDSKINEYYIGLWPSRATNCHLSDTYTGQFVDAGSPLLRYYDFGGDNYIADVYHNGGCCCADEDLVSGTEVLTRFDYDIDPEEHNHMHGKAAIWAYKADTYSGRVIMSGSHPESVKDGERRDLMAALLRYAMDGQGATKSKGILHRGETIVMDKYSTDLDPSHARIGDMQCHHFLMWIPEGSRKIKVTLRPYENFKFKLMLAKETFAYPEDAQYTFESKGGAEAVAEFDSLPAGQWYICVQCVSVPSYAPGDNGVWYNDKAILNGAAYELSLSYK